MAGLRLLTDEALCEDTEEKDGLGFKRYAEILGDAVIQADEPFTMGIFGEWGMGKTSLMRLIQSHLDKKRDVATIWFNSWQYEKEEHPIIPLIATIIKQLEAKKNTAGKLKSYIKKLADTLRSAAYGFSISSKLGLAGTAEVGLGFSAKEAIDRSEKLSTDPLLEKSLYYGAFERLSSLELPQELRIVVLIDDLDRCFPDSAIKLLESIKLAFSQKGFTFIIGVARKIIEGYLTHRYKETYGIEDFQGHLYLNKIVQLPFYLPSHQLEAVTFKKQILERIDESAKKDVGNIFHIISMTSNNNPRILIRFINNLLIDLAVQTVSSELDENIQPIPLSFFAVTRYLQTKWDEIFDFLMESDELCEDIGKWNENELAEKKELKTENRAFIAGCCIEDKNIRNILFSTEGKQWLLSKEQRRKTVDFIAKNRSGSQEKEIVDVELKKVPLAQFARNQPRIDTIERLEEIQKKSQISSLIEQIKKNSKVPDLEELSRQLSQIHTHIDMPGHTLTFDDAKPYIREKQSLGDGALF